MEIFKLKPVFKDYIWGGTRLKDDFGFESNLDKLAEGWMLACHKDGKSIIENGEYAGKTLENVINEIGAVKLSAQNLKNFRIFLF